MKLLIPIIIIAAIIFIIVLAVNFVSAFIAGAFNVILGVIVVIALIIIIVWMFAYAKKSR